MRDIVCHQPGYWTVAIIGNVNTYDAAPVISWLRAILGDQEIEVSSLGESITVCRT